MTISRDIQRLKRNAKRLKKQTGCTHTEALDAIARECGYANWAQLMKKESNERETKA